MYFESSDFLLVCDPTKHGIATFMFMMLFGCEPGVVLILIPEDDIQTTDPRKYYTKLFNAYMECYSKCMAIRKFSASVTLITKVVSTMNRSYDNDYFITYNLPTEDTMLSDNIERLMTRGIPLENVYDQCKKSGSNFLKCQDNNSPASRTFNNVFDTVPYYKTYQYECVSYLPDCREKFADCMTDFIITYDHSFSISDGGNPSLGMSFMTCIGNMRLVPSVVSTMNAYHGYLGGGVLDAFIPNLSGALDDFEESLGDAEFLPQVTFNESEGFFKLKQFTSDMVQAMDPSIEINTNEY